MAAISHLPYAVAAALVQRRGHVAATTLAWALAASGFRDTTRVAASDVDMMLDILLTNREAVLDWLDASPPSLPPCALRWPTAMRLRLRSQSEPPRRETWVAGMTAC